MNTISQQRELNNMLLMWCKEYPIRKHRVKECLENGAYINAQDESGDTPLMLCIRNWDKVLFCDLLDLGADPYITNKVNENTLLLAFRNGQKWCIDELFKRDLKFDLDLQTTDKEKTTALHAAIDYDLNHNDNPSFQMARSLLKKGNPRTDIANSDGRTVIDILNISRLYPDDSEREIFLKEMVTLTEKIKNQDRQDRKDRAYKKIDNLDKLKAPLKRKRLYLKRKP